MIVTATRRRRTLAILTITGIGVAALAAALVVMWPQPAIAPLAGASAPASPAVVERGARIVAVGDCMVCHTAKGGQPFAGGLPLKTPFGTIYSTNITPHRATGIGAWPYAAFERAMRHGVSRDGHLLYPAFPYIHYTQMSDADIGAAYAYLQTRTPVPAPARPNALVFPLGFRPLLAGWNLLFLRPGNRLADAAQVTATLRGRYLVDGPGHCASCHSGLNALGAERSAAFGGGHIEGWDAPALTTLSSLDTPWTTDQLVDYLHTGMSHAHGASKGPMQPVTGHLAEVPLEEVRAVVAYLDQLQTGAPLDSRAPANARASISGDAAQRLRGAMLFAGACASCHGDSSPLRQVNGRPGIERSRSLEGDRANNFLRIVHEGVGRTNAPPGVYMPPFAAVFSDADIAALAAYSRADLAGRQPWQQVEQASRAMRTTK